MDELIKHFLGSPDNLTLKQIDDLCQAAAALTKEDHLSTDELSVSDYTHSPSYIEHILMTPVTKLRDTTPSTAPSMTPWDYKATANRTLVNPSLPIQYDGNRRSSFGAESQKPRMCKYYSQGKCSKGVICQFAHTKEQLRAAYAQSNCGSFSNSNYTLSPISKSLRMAKMQCNSGTLLYRIQDNRLRETCYNLRQQMSSLCPVPPPPCSSCRPTVTTCVSGPITCQRQHACVAPQFPAVIVPHGCNVLLLTTDLRNNLTPAHFALNVTSSALASLRVSGIPPPPPPPPPASKVRNEYVPPPPVHRTNNNFRRL